MKVVVYSLPSCPGCDQVKKFLEENDVKYDVVDVSDTIKAREMVEKYKVMSVPVTVIDDQVVVGAKLDEIKRLISK